MFNPENDLKRSKELCLTVKNKQGHFGAEGIDTKLNALSPALANRSFDRKLPINLSVDTAGRYSHLWKHSNDINNYLNSSISGGPPSIKAQHHQLVDRCQTAQGIQGHRPTSNIHTGPAATDYTQQSPSSKAPASKMLPDFTPPTHATQNQSDLAYRKHQFATYKDMIKREKFAGREPSKVKKEPGGARRH